MKLDQRIETYSDFTDDDVRRRPSEVRRSTSHCAIAVRFTGERATRLKRFTGPIINRAFRLCLQRRDKLVISSTGMRRGLRNDSDH